MKSQVINLGSSVSSLIFKLVLYPINTFLTGRPKRTQGTRTFPKSRQTLIQSATVPIATATSYCPLKSPFPVIKNDHRILFFNVS